MFVLFQNTFSDIYRQSYLALELEKIDLMGLLNSEYRDLYLHGYLFSEGDCFCNLRRV